MVDQETVQVQPDPDSVVIFCAHADDEALGAGGTIAKYANDGKTIHRVIFTLGESSHPWLQAKYTHQMRMKETEVSGKIIGCEEAIFLNLRDTKIGHDTKKPSVRRKIRDIILEHRPARIFTHSEDDIHQDHLAVVNTVLEILDTMEYDCDVYSFPVWNPFILRKTSNPWLFVDISEYYERKIKAIQAFKSQWMSVYQLLPFVWWRAVFAGRKNKTKYAEVFLKVR